MQHFHLKEMSTENSLV